MKSEFAFIESLRVRAACQAIPYQGVIRGIGDDAAILRATEGYELLITTDLLVEDIDFGLDYTLPHWLGHKALAVSLSDIAAMGGRARQSLLSLGIPRTYNDAFWLEFFDGYFALAATHNITLVGGDISSSPDRLLIDSIIIGECKRGAAVGRDGAHVGDAIYMTGAVGASAAGLRLLKQGMRVNINEDDLAQRALRAQLRPEPPVEFGYLIGERRLAQSMIDVSDGLAQDLAHICAESHVSAVIDFALVPIAPEVSLVENDSERAFNLAISGGEDFELLLTSKPEQEPDLMAIATGCEIKLTRIGEVILQREMPLYLRREGELKSLSACGYDHFDV